MHDQSLGGIAEKLKVLLPVLHNEKLGLRKRKNKVILSEFNWCSEKVHRILTNQAYCGDVVNFKSHSKSFKLKKQIAVPKEDWAIHKDKHPAIIERDVWEIVQKTFGGTKLRKPRYRRKNWSYGAKCLELD